MNDVSNVTVRFGVDGEIALEHGAASVDRLNTSLAALMRTTNGQAKAVRLLERELNTMSASATHAASTGFNVLNRSVGDAFSSLQRLGRYGFYAFSAGAATAIFTARGLVREFTRVNEQFANLEISVSSAFKSDRLGRLLRNQLRDVSVTSPVPLKDLATATRGLSFIPQLSSQVGKQAAFGTLSDQKGFFKGYLDLVEQMMVFRPDKQVEDVTFSLREAVTGELRSLIRRFDFPAQMLVNTSGRSLSDLRKDPEGMIAAIKGTFDKIITDEARRKIAQQPTRLMQQAREQFLEIPLLEIGDAGLYQKLLGSFQKFISEATAFIQRGFKPYAARLSNSLGEVFDTLLLSANNVTKRVLASLGKGPESISSSGFENFAELVATAAERVSETLPKAITRLSAFFERVTPGILSILDVLTKLGEFFSEKFERSPWLTTLGVYLVNRLPTAFGFALQGAFSRVTKTVQGSIASTMSNVLSGHATPVTGGFAAQQPFTLNTGPGGTLTRYGVTANSLRQFNQNSALLARLGANASTTVAGQFSGAVPPVARFAGVTGRNFTANAYTGQGATPAITAWLQAQGFAPVGNARVTNLPGYFDDARNRRILAQYGVEQHAATGRLRAVANNAYGVPAGSFISARNLPPEVLERTNLAGQFAQAAAGGAIGTRVAAFAGRTALGLGLGTGTASAVATGTAGVAAIASSVVIPLVAAVASTWVIELIVNKVRTHFADAAKARAEKDFGAFTAERQEADSRKGQSVINYFSDVLAKRNRADDQKFVDSLTLNFPVLRKEVKEVAFQNPTAAMGGFGGGAAMPLKIRSTDFGIGSTNLGIENAQKAFALLQADYEALTSKAIAAKEGNGDFEEFFLKSAPEISVSASNLSKILPKVEEAFGLATSYVNQFSAAFSSRLKVGMTPVLTAEQEGLMQKLRDASSVSSGKGILGVLSNESNRVFDRNTGQYNEVPTNASRLFSQLQSMADSPERAALTEEATESIRKVMLTQRPFESFVGTLEQDLLRVKDIMDVRAEFESKVASLGKDADLGKATAAEWRELISKARRLDLPFDLKELSERVSTLEAGGSSAQKEFIEFFRTTADQNLFNGLVSRTRMIYASLLSNMERAGAATTGSDFSIVAEERKHLFEQYQKQLSARGFGSKEIQGLFSEAGSILSQYRNPFEVGEGEREIVESINRVMDDSLAILIRKLNNSVLNYVKSSGKFTATDIAEVEGVTNDSEVIARQIELTTSRERSRLERAQMEYFRSRGSSAFASSFSETNLVSASQRREFAESRTDASVFAARYGAQLPSADIMGLPTGQGNFKTSNSLAQFREIEAAAERNAKLFRELATTRLEAGSLTDFKQFDELARSMSAAAAEARKLREELTGRNGMLGSFKEGFSEVTNLWRESASNFTQIGRSMAESLSSSMSGAFSDFILGAKTAKESLKDFAKSVLTTAVNLLTQKMVQQLLGMLFSFGNPAGAIIASAGTNVIGSATSGGFTSLATGSYISGSSGVTGGLSYGGGNYDGGLLPGPAASHDNLLIRAASGEFIIPISAVKKFGVDHFMPYLDNRLPDGVTSRISRQADSARAYYRGGPVGMSTPPQASSGGSGAVVNVYVNVASDGTARSSVETNRDAEKLGSIVKTVVDERLMHHFRPGGLFASRRIAPN